MTRKPYLVAANDGSDETAFSERLTYALGRMEQASGAHERQFLINGDLMSVHLPTDLWLVLDGIAMEEGVMTAHLVELIARRTKPGLALATAIRAFILVFHRQAP